MQNFKKIIKFLPRLIGYGTLLAAAAAIVLITYWEVKDYKPIVLNTPKIEVLPGDVYAGGTVHLSINFCKNVEAIDDVQVFLESDISSISLPPYKSYAPAGCHIYDDIEIKIPSGASSAVYHIRYVVKNDVNPVREVTTTLTSYDFNVINKKL